LESVRRAAYEFINQLQHEALVLEAASDLAAHNFAGQEITWWWNPRQTGGADEPDLRGEVDDKVVVSVEVTTSRRPLGKVAERMVQTLEKLAKFPGRRLYYVRTPEMAQRAERKVEVGEYPIEVRVIAVEDDADND